MPTVPVFGGAGLQGDRFMRLRGASTKRQARSLPRSPQCRAHFRRLALPIVLYPAPSGAPPSIRIAIAASSPAMLVKKVSIIFQMNQMIILGLNTFHGDSAAGLVREAYRLEEERLRRVKDWPDFRRRAWRKHGCGLDVRDHAAAAVVASRAALSARRVAAWIRQRLLSGL